MVKNSKNNFLIKDEEENNQAGINHDSNIKEGVIASFEGSGEEEKEFELDKGKEDKIHRLNKDTPQFMRRADRIYNFDEMSQAPVKRVNNQILISFFLEEV